MQDKIEAKTLKDVIEKLEAGEWVGFENYPPRIVNFLKHLKKDSRILGQLMFDLKFIKGGESVMTGDESFPISVRIFNAADEAPEVRAYFGGGDTYSMVVYFGTSPEIENTVVLPLWVTASRPAKKVYKLIYEVLRKDPNAVLSLKGKYRWKPPNIVQPFWANKIDTTTTTDFYDWPHLPYLKVVDESIAPPYSPIGYHRVLFQDERGDRETEYVNIQCAALQVAEKRSEEVLAFALPIGGPRSKPWPLAVSPYISQGDRKILYGLRQREPALALVYRVPGDVRWHIWKVLQVEPLEFLKHAISWGMYSRYINKPGLKIFSMEQLRKYFAHCESLVSAFCRTHFSGHSILMQPEKFFPLHFWNFFRLYSDGVYYLPKLLGSISEKELKQIDGLVTQSAISDSRVKRIIFIKKLKQLVYSAIKLPQVLLED